ncbi:MAG: 3-phosphoserine/phosphohydroxythreonine transaminase [Candidatus Thorarchaeota archaeon]|nr:3-phosphoserine/phosphohydroxythreonine transaminase [Candidatus Thorarchaeota archaeon]
MTKRVLNFYPGPATLPLPALEKAQKELLDYQGTGMSILEISHRSDEYDKIHIEASALVRELMGVPDDYKILWLQGGASTQFLMVPVNLQVPGKPMQYVDTGTWASKALKEAKLYGDVEVIASSKNDNYAYVPSGIEFGDKAAYAHITSNNTIYGTQYHYWPKVPKDVPLVVDMSSDLMARKIDVRKFGVIYAGAQKNLGPAGVTLVIVREDLLDRVPEKTPTLLKWKTEAEKDSLFHTPPTFIIYISKLAMEYWKEFGGVEAIQNQNEQKAKLLYDVIDNSDGFYKGHARKDSRSIMNVTFTMKTPELEEKCGKEAIARELVGLPGHRSVGGMRASIYNAMTLEGVKTLADFLTEFKEKNQ